MHIKTLSACFTGHRASKLPYDEKSKEHEKLENVLKEEIKKLIRLGVSEFYVGGQNGIDKTCSLLILYLKDHIGGTANLNLVFPYRGIEKGFTELQKDNLNWIKRHAKTVKILHRKYTDNCYRERNQYMVDRSDFLIAVQIPATKSSGTQMTINMAREKGIEIRLIDPITYEVEVIPTKEPISIFIE